MFSNRRFGYGSATFGYGGGRISRSFMDGISARTSLLGLWSTARRTWSGYSGAILRARRSSDNAERDFFPNGPQGEVSTAELRAWNGWNRFSHSENLAGATWAKPSGAVNHAIGTLGIESDVAASPSGAMTADRVNFVNQADADLGLNQAIAATGGVTYTCSFMIKGEGSDVGKQIRLRMKRNTAGAFVGSNATITLTDSWVRHSLTLTLAADHVDIVCIFSSAVGGATAALLTELQLERASSFSTYEPRTTTAAGDSFLVTLYEQAENGRNLLARTEEFSDSYWSKSNVTVTANGGIGPDGQNNMFTIAGTGAGTNAVFAATSLTVPTNTTYTYSVYLRKGNSLNPRLRVLNNASSVNLLDITFLWSGAAPTVSSSSGVIGGVQIQEVSSGLYRVSAAFSTGAETTARYWLYSSASNNTEQLIAGYAQLEVGSTATTYERRTTHGAGTRLNFTQATTTLQPILCEQGVPVTENGRLAGKFVAADARRMSIAGSTAMFNALHTTGGTVLCVSKANDTAAVKVILRNKTSSNLAGFQLARQAGENAFMSTGRLDVAGVATIGNTIDVGFSGTISTAQSIIAAVYDPDNATAGQRAFLWHNGAASPTANAATGTPFVENTASDLSLGSTPGGSSPHDGTISEVALFSSLISTADRVTLEDRAGDFYGVTVTQPITITTQPTSLIASPGQPFTLTCVGTNVQTYNWQFRNAGDTAWSAVGVQTSALTVTATDEMAGREYRCVLINPNASATSNTATITAQGIAARVGTFNSPTVLGSQSVTGVGFQPKVILQKSALVNGATAGAMLNIGAATATAQASVAATSRNGVTTSETERRHINNGFIGHEAWSGGITGITASRTSLDIDGFTFEWSAVSAGSWPLTYTALGGSTLEANLVECQMNGTNAAESFAHGLSGAPTAILLFSPITSVASPTTQTILYFTIGAWAGGTQFGASIFSNNGVTTTLGRRLLSTSHCLAFLAAAVNRAMVVSSVDSVNVNVAYPVSSDAGQYRFYMLCLRGCKAQVGTFDLNGSLDPYSISCAGITPRLFLPVFIPNGVDLLDSVLTSALLTIGSSDGTTTVSCGISDQSAVTTTNTRRFQSLSDLEEYSVTGTKLSESVVSFSGQSVVIDASTNDSGVGQGGYLIIGE